MQIGDNAYMHNVAPLTGITITNLTFCGALANAGGSAPHLGCPASTALTAESCKAPNCDGDLWISNTSAATWSAPADAPFTLPCPGGPPCSYHVTLTNAAFADAVHGHPIFIGPNGTGQLVNDVHITNSEFSGGNVQHGSFVQPSVWWGDHTQCDNWPNGAFADDLSASLPPRNIRFDYNTWHSGRGGISGIARYLTTDHNTFTGYYWPGGDVGGTIEQEGCADKVNITNNTIDGAWTSGSVQQGGMELYGRNIYVYNNVVKNQAWGGISILSTYHARVVGNHLWNNGQAGDQFPHIGVATSYPGDGTCSPGVACDAVRDTDGPIVQNNDSSDPANGNAVQPSPLIAKGVWLDGGSEGSTSNMINLVNGAISGNSMTLAANGSQIVASQRVSINGLPVSVNGAENSSLTSIIGSEALIGSDFGVHTIAVFPEGQQPLGSALCYTDSTWRCFQFGANDPLGAGDLTGQGASIEGYFDTADCNSANLPCPVSDLPQVGGAFIANQPSCHFMYVPASRALYLADTSTAQNFGPGAAMGSGTVLDNGACQIYTGSSSMTSSGNTYTLVLDVKFLSPGTWYIYEIVTNSQGIASTGNQRDAQGNPVFDANTGSLIVWSLWGYWQR